LTINNIATPSAKLWLLDGDSVAQDDLAFFTRRLGSSETRRLVSFARPERKRQFILGRMLLRVAVSDLLGVPIDNIDVVERPGNAPRLVLSDPLRLSPHFSLSHSRNWVACVVSCDADLGLDIEVNDASRDIAGISELAFHPNVAGSLSSGPNSDPVSSFYDRWCEREALLKVLSNLGRDVDLAPAPLEFEKFDRHRQTGPSTRLSVVVLSNRRLLAIREIILTDFTRANSIAEGKSCDAN
jgi:4'-phosphopantetheinyl transferase